MKRHFESLKHETTEWVKQDPGSLGYPPPTVSSDTGIQLVNSKLQTTRKRHRRFPLNPSTRRPFKRLAILDKNFIEPHTDLRKYQQDTEDSMTLRQARTSISRRTYQEDIKDRLGNMP